jgi:hypothetical protein
MAVATGACVRRFKITLSVVAFAVLCGCTAQNVKQDEPLAPGEGVLVTTVHCGIGGVFWIEFYPAGQRSKGMTGSLSKAGSTGCERATKPPALRTIRLKEGKYFIGKIGQQSFVDIPEKDALSFMIEAGKLNYIGDLSIGGIGAGTVYVDIGIRDVEPVARQRLDAEYPWLAQRYSWTKRLAVDPRPHE